MKSAERFALNFQTGLLSEDAIRLRWLVIGRQAMKNEEFMRKGVLKDGLKYTTISHGNR